MIQKKYLASLDQSTTTTKFSLYLFDGTLVDQQIIPHEQITTHQGWLQHNPKQILSSVSRAIELVIHRQNAVVGFTTEQILGLGLCNQRETLVCWDSETGQPLYNSIVWCDSRTKTVCENFKNKYDNKFSKRTGLPVSTYFTFFKILWLLENVQGLKQRLKQKKVRFGTIDTWVALYLTGKYITDASNASRTYLVDLSTGQWDEQILNIAQIPLESLPTIIDSFETVGQIVTTSLKGVPLTCVLGDQQSSAYAHNLSSSQMKITYGTGCFMLTNIGTQPCFDDAFVTTIMYQQKKKISYGYQISVECGGGTINWSKKVGFITSYDQLNHLQSSNQDLFFFPSFGTIFSPFWKTNIQGGLVGLNFNTNKQDILRSILDAITFRLYDNIKNEKLKQVKKIIVDGGMTANQQFMQLQADLFGKQIQVRTLDTCWGVAKGVLTATGVKGQAIKFSSTIYNPVQNNEKLLEKYEKWNEARNKFYRW